MASQREIAQTLSNANDMLRAIGRRYTRARGLLMLCRDTLPPGALRDQVVGHLDAEDVDPEDRAAIARIGG